MISKIFGGLLGGSKAPPAPSLPTPMPLANDAAIEAAKRKKMAAVQAQSGRASTILTDMGMGSSGSDKLG